MQEVALMIVSITLSLGLIPVPDDAERQRGCTPRLMIATKSLVVWCLKKKEKKKLFLNVRMKKMSWAVCNQMCNEFHKLVWIRVCRTSWRACAGTLSFHSNLLLEQRQQRQETQCCCFYKPERCGRSCLPFSFFSFVSNFTISDCISILNDPFCSASASESYHLRGRTYRDVHSSRSLSV